MLRKVVLVLTVILILAGCTAVKPYQRIYLNDPEMLMNLSAGKSFEDYVLSIREGSLIAGSKKSVGGCGCN